MSKAYSYIRFSTPEQLKGDSLRRQLDLSERYATDHGLVLDNMKLQDLGVSAYSGEHRDRGALASFLRLIEMGKIEKGSVLLVESFDRLSREEITKALRQFLDIIEKGIKIVTLLDNREYTTETINANVTELMFSLMIMGRAHEESATKALRLTAAWEGKRKQVGIKKLTAKAPAWLQLSDDKTQFTVIADRQVMIRRLFDLKLSGKGKTAIVRELNHMTGWKPGSTDSRKQGGGWRESYIQKILQSRAVIGEFQPHKLLKGKRQPIGDPIPDYFPALIDKDIFYRVQEQFRQNEHKGGQTGKVSNLFSHIAKCGYCGASMALIDKGSAPKGGKYLVCDRARRNLGCCRTSIRYGELENLILSHCKGLKPQDLLAENDDTATSRLKNEMDGLSGELNGINAEIENLADSISTTSDKRVREMLEKRMGASFDKQNELKQQIAHLKQEIARLSQSFETTQETLDSLKELLAFLNTAKTGKLIEVRIKLRNELRKLIDRIDVFPEGRSRFTIETAEKALKDMSMVIPKGSEGYEQIKDNLRQRTERPKEFRSFIIRFTSGSLRFIVPKREMQLAFDMDKEEKVLRIYNTKPDGTMICEEYSQDGLHIKDVERQDYLNRI